MATSYNKRKPDACFVDFHAKFAGVKNSGLLYTRIGKQSYRLRTRRRQEGAALVARPASDEMIIYSS